MRAKTNLPVPARAAVLPNFTQACSLAPPLNTSVVLEAVLKLPLETRSVRQWSVFWHFGVCAWWLFVPYRAVSHGLLQDKKAFLRKPFRKAEVVFQLEVRLVSVVELVWRVSPAVLLRITRECSGSSEYSCCMIFAGSDFLLV